MYVCDCVLYLLSECIALTGHIQAQLALVVLAHLDPAILTRHRLLEVDDVISSWTVAVAVKAKIIAAEACTHTNKCFGVKCVYGLTP